MRGGDRRAQKPTQADLTKAGTDRIELFLSLGGNQAERSVDIILEPTVQPSTPQGLRVSDADIQLAHSEKR